MELPTRKVMTLELAKRLAAAAIDHAHAIGHDALVVLVVDAGGYPVYLERMDGVMPGTVQVALLKAQSSAAFGQPSKHFEQTVADGLTGLVGLPGMAAFEGAVPIRVDGHVVGAVAISGLTKELDGEIAQAAVDAVADLLHPT
jgi:glc operon protein GlcG